MENKYQGVEHEALLKAIQKAAERLLDPATKKKISTKRYSQSVLELNEMRRMAIERLVKMNRNDPKFFPVGIKVEYRPYVPPSLDEWAETAQKVQHAVVVGMDERYSYITIDGEGITYKVDPNTLTIKFMRTAY